jgi:hypothetical protein
LGELEIINFFDFDGNKIEKECEGDRKIEIIYGYINGVASLFLDFQEEKELIFKYDYIIEKFDKRIVLPFKDFDLAKLMKIKMLSEFRDKYGFVKKIVEKYENFEYEILHKLI